ncbi:hypothetical protein J8F10_29645 [Gemmata sp. G18]|uniref:HEPN domain-containing protein n=1 Tax=Gemmata palustris TaxID=2822762 RepID=A0ABS5C2R3_9BACT|nr:hypothetical protein [Gemmata palustris]MBP3959428.1 hypothetical protein [Gemmata palustris]
MNRLQLQRLAIIRLDDAAALIDKQRWSAAHYLAGYAIECGLKACLLKYLGESGAIYSDPSYLKKLADCWTHDLAKLVNLAGLDADFGAARGASAALDGFWSIVKDWKETSRYEERTETEARALYEAVSHAPNGVFPWIQSRW